MVFLAVNFNLSMNPLKNELNSDTPKSIKLLYIRGREFVMKLKEIKREKQPVEKREVNKLYSGK